MAYRVDDNVNYTKKRIFYFYRFYSNLNKIPNAYLMYSTNEYKYNRWLIFDCYCSDFSIRIVEQSQNSKICTLYLNKKKKQKEK